MSSKLDNTSHFEHIYVQEIGTALAVCPLFKIAIFRRNWCTKLSLWAFCRVWCTSCWLCSRRWLINDGHVTWFNVAVNFGLTCYGCLTYVLSGSSHWRRLCVVSTTGCALLLSQSIQTIKAIMKLERARALCIIWYRMCSDHKLRYCNNASGFDVCS